MRHLRMLPAMLIFALFVAIMFSCKKPPGPGGRATVKGKVYAYDYDNTQNYLISQGYSAGDKVFIVYGSDQVVGNNLITSMDGSFEFKYLTKGHYKIFVNSIDTSYKVKGNDTEIPIVQEFEIKDPKETIVLKDFVINK